MIALITGKIVEKHPTRVLIDVNGIGYELNIPISSYEKLKEKGEDVKLHTFLYVREDIMQLYGFSSLKEKEMFQLLIGVSGIGPKSAIGMLSSISIGDLQQGILSENTTLLSSVPGVGKKTAQRLILELKDKVLLKTGPVVESGRGDASGSEIWQEAVMALTSLGYGKALAEKTVIQITRESTNQPTSLEECIKLSLRALTRA